MISRTELRKLAGSASYNKGIGVYESGYVRNFNIEEFEWTDTVSAKVKGSGYNIYNVKFEYDIDIDEIDNISCECPAFDNYEGICKHCVAVVLKYEEYQEEAAENAGFESLIVNTTTATMNRPITTPSIKDLLNHQVTKRTIPIIEEEIQGKITLEPHLTIRWDEYLLSFKIGMLQKYVVKDVFELVDAIKNNEFINYGKKLQFTHTLEAFDEESKPIASFLCNWAENNRKHFMTMSYYGYSQSKCRQIPLDGGMLEAFLNAMGDNEFEAYIQGEKAERWKVTEKELPMELVLQGTDDGVKVSINILNGYASGNENIYFIDGDVYRVPHSSITAIDGFLQCMSRIPNREIFIENEDVPLFCRELLPNLEQHFKCSKVDFDEMKYGVIPVTFELYLDAPQKNCITCKALAIYGDDRYNLYDRNNNASRRDQVAEIEMESLIRYYCSEYNPMEECMYLEEEEDKLYSLLVDGIPKLHKVAEVFVSDRVKRLKVTTHPKVSVGISVNGDLMELKMDSDDLSNVELIEILSKYSKKKKYYRLKNGDFVNIEGEEIEALLELKQGLHLTESELKKQVVEVPKYRALYIDSELKKWNSLRSIKNKEFKALIRNMKTIEDNDYEIPYSLESILREYQKRGYLWIKTLKYNGFGGILADDMGLGKTLQVITFLLSEYLERKPNKNCRTLIVCPASLVYNWGQEISRFAPELESVTVTGTAVERKNMIEDLTESQIAITSYDLLRRDIVYYQEKRFHCQILDEAQYIKNSSTQVAKAVKLITASFKLALTGTPIENRLSELWSIFDYIMPGFLYSYEKFKKEVEIPIVQNGDELVTKRIQNMIQPFVLRRLKRDVLTDLPEKIEENVFVELSGEQQKLYIANAKKLKNLLGKQSQEEFNSSKIQVLAELTKLRQICCEPSLVYSDYTSSSAKLDMCMELVQNAVEGGHKILLFSQFTSMLEMIQQRLSSDRISFYALTGATSKEKRADLVARFNEDNTSVFCISLKAGGTGLNLTSADIVIHYDPWWNYAVQSQATDRAYRIGQTNIVNVYRLIVKNTIEENIAKVQEQKRELADQILGGEGMKTGSFSKEELLEMLG